MTDPVKRAKTLLDLIESSYRELIAAFTATNPKEREQKVKAVLYRWLEHAFDAGNIENINQQIHINALLATIERLRTQVAHLSRELSAQRKRFRETGEVMRAPREPKNPTATFSDPDDPA